jgi:hypothetical protein
MGKNMKLAGKYCILKKPHYKKSLFFIDETIIFNHRILRISLKEYRKKSFWIDYHVFMCNYQYFSFFSPAFFKYLIRGIYDKIKAKTKTGSKT